MRTKLLLLALLGALGTTGCTSVLSLSPAVTDSDALKDPALDGQWVDEHGIDLYSVRQTGETLYEIIYTAKGESPEEFEGRLFQAGDARLLDLVQKDERLFSFMVPAHFFVRIWVDGASLRMAFVDSEWFRDQTSREQVATSPVSDGVLLTAPADQVRRLLLKYGGDERAHGETGVLHRLQTR
jgi:hypothetical protein